MTFSLAEAVLLLALMLTSGIVAATYRELRRQQDYRREFARILVDTSTALEGIDRTVRDFDQRGNTILKALGVRIDQAREVLGEIDRLPPDCGVTRRPNGAAGSRAPGVEHTREG